MDRFTDIFNPQFRLAILKLFGAGAILVLLGKIISLTVFSGEYYRDLSLGNRAQNIVIPANRGIIYDRFGAPLVINFPAFLLKNCVNTDCHDEIISKDEAFVQKDARPVASRRYLYGTQFSHLLGYVNLSDNLGVLGIESEYNSSLKGVDGRKIVEVDAKGEELRLLGSIPPVAGKNVTLTVSLGVQKATALAMGEKRGAVVASIPSTGEIIALYSSPSFDPNIFTTYYSDLSKRNSDLASVLTDKNQPMFDRAIGATYPPGSTFKIISAAAGLESGRITPETRIEDTGIMVIGPFKFPNWKFLRDGGTEGILDIVGAIKRSNDIFFYKLGGEVGVDGLTAMAERFGLGKTSGIDLPGESVGLVPGKSWREKYAREWYLGDTYHLSIGQADLLTTPLQVNNWTSAIANGGKKCRPVVVAEIAGVKKTSFDCSDIKLSDKTINTITEGLKEACSPGGTAWPLFDYKVKDRPVQIACKTGTAEFGDTAKGQTHAWLTGYAPFERPEIAVTVLIEGGGEGSDVAAPIAKKVFDAWFEETKG